MKHILLFTLITTSVLTSAQAFTCVAGRQDLVKFTATVNATAVKIVFDKKQSQEGKDLAGKTVTLKYDSVRGNTEWKYNIGKVLVDKDYQDYIHIEMGYKASALGQKKLEGNFAMSPRSDEDGPSYLDMMGLSCQ
jgi:hypothetical protein